MSSVNPDSNNNERDRTINAAMRAAIIAAADAQLEGHTDDDALLAARAAFDTTKAEHRARQQRAARHADAINADTAARSRVTFSAPRRGNGNGKVIRERPQDTMP
jgi:hypothetical protein